MGVDQEYQVDTDKMMGVSGRMQVMGIENGRG